MIDWPVILGVIAGVILAAIAWPIVFKKSNRE